MVLEHLDHFSPTITSPNPSVYEANEALGASAQNPRRSVAKFASYQLRWASNQVITRLQKSNWFG